MVQKNTANEQKQAAAEAAVTHLLEQIKSSKSETVLLGIGSGSTIVFAVNALEKMLSANESNPKIICVPTSFQAKQLIQESKSLELGSMEQFPELDYALDGADECNSNLNLIKGGGGCLTQEKIVAYAAKQFFVICDESKDSSVLGEKWKKGVPVEVVPMSYTMVQLKLKEKLNASAVPLRMAQSKAGPCVTDNGMFIIDAVFPDMTNTVQLEEKILSIPGVVCTGLFNEMASKVFFAYSDGSVKVKSK